METLLVLSWKPLCVSMPATELTSKCWHPHLKEIDKENGIIQCESCKKKWLGVRKLEDLKKELNL